MAQPILEVHDLVKYYGINRAVDGISFSVEEGEVFGLLGPNGAGKSTAIGVLTGLFPPDEGKGTVAGFDIVSDVETVKRLIGVAPQDLALYPALSARENLRFFGEMYGLNGARLRERVDSVLEVVSMTDRANDPVQSYSGGMKRRVNLAAGLINHPRLLFLDEPTVGVDPQSRNHIFESVEKLNREQGMAVLYTTHYMEEAERLCNRVAIIDHGKIIALDTPRNLVATLGGGIIHLSLPPADPLDPSQADEEILRLVQGLEQVRAASFLPPAGDMIPGEPAARRTLKVETHQAGEALIQLIQLFKQKNVEILAVETLEPNLETVFLHLTGKSLRE